MTYYVHFNKVTLEIFVAGMDQDNILFGGIGSVGPDEVVTNQQTVMASPSDQFVSSYTLGVIALGISERIAPPTEPVLDKAQLLADGADTATLSGLPSDAFVKINDVLTPIASGSVSVSFTSTEVIIIRLVGKYKAAPWIVQCIDPTDYMDKVREEREPLLRACDWTMLPDAQLSSSEVADWLAYRQALRDITTAITARDVAHPSDERLTLRPSARRTEC